MAKDKKQLNTKSSSGTLGRHKSPWGRGPNCAGAGARASHMRYVKNAPKPVSP